MLLAVLAVRAGDRGIHGMRLAETAWDGKPLWGAAVTMRSHVKRLWFQPGSAGRKIVAGSPGYSGREVAEAEPDLRASAGG